MSDAELNIKLKLDSEQAKQEAQKAGEQISNSAGGVFKKTVDPQQLDAQRKLIASLGQATQQSIRKASNLQMNSQVNLYRFMEREDKKKEMRNLRFMRLTESMTKNYSMLSGVVFNPLGGLTTMFSARQVFQARRDKSAQDRLSGRGGESIGASIIATGMMVGGATAAGLALKGFAEVVEQSKKAIQFSRNVYGKAMTSGFGVGGQTYRSMTSDILGVDEKELMKFGAALAYLNPRIKTAQEALSKANNPLAEIGINVKVIEYNFMALAATLTTKAQPAIMLFIDAINMLSEVAIKNSALIFGGVKLLGETALKAIFGPNMGAILAGLISKATGLYSSVSKTGLPQAQAFMKQLPASAWERMGLVVGGSGGTNYGKQTAENTRDMKKSLHQIATKLGVGDRHGTYTYSLP